MCLRRHTYTRISFGRSKSSECKNVAVVFTIQLNVKRKTRMRVGEHNKYNKYNNITPRIDLLVSAAGNMKRVIKIALQK